MIYSAEAEYCLREVALCLEDLAVGPYVFEADAVSYIALSVMTDRYADLSFRSTEPIRLDFTVFDKYIYGTKFAPS